MKRLLAVFLTSCMIVGLASPAGSGIMTEISANTKAALMNLSDSGERTESAAEGAGNFDQAIRDLYDNSMSATDEEVLAAAEMMDSDFAVVESRMGDEAQDLIDYLKYYEAEKSRYIAGSEQSNFGFSGEVVSEWDRQGEYTSYVMSADDMVRTMVPRIKVTGCDMDGDQASLDIYEWMTVGYAADDVSAVNATAYGYDFSLTLDRGSDGSWIVASVDDTDQNFDWMEEEVEYSLQAEAESADPLRVVFEDGGQEMMAATAARTYSYNVDKAIAYADKYCINYNSSYNSYKGRGGDCANFVSQCLYNGGFPQDSTWYKHSVAWINVMKQIAHFKQYGTFMKATNGNILKGNPIYFDWNGDSTYDHATICVGRNNSGTAILDSHTKDLYHATWDHWSFSKAATIQLRGSGSSSSTSSEGGTWKSDSNGKWYEFGDGTYLLNCFKTIDGKTYYFHNKGYAAKGLHKIKGYYYYFNANCEMVTGWVTVNGKKYYFGSDGKGYTEWNEIGGKMYYFDPTYCVMAKGFYKVKTKLHYFDSNGIEQFGWITVSGKKYHLDEYGVVQFGWQTIGGKKYFFDTNGAMVTGNVKIDGVIYSFDKNGIYKDKSSATTANTIVDTRRNTTTSSSSTSTAAKNGWVKQNGKTYYYVNGKPKTGWLKVGGKFYNLGTNGVMVKGWKKINGYWYYFVSDGSMKTGWLKLGTRYFFLDQNGRMRTGWLKRGTKYFFLDSEGAMKTGWHKDADGETYYLGSNGVMVTGKQVINGRTYYFNRWGALQ